MTRSEGIEAMKREAEPGHCYLCDMRLPKHKRRWGHPGVRCGAKACNVLYHRVYDSDTRGQTAKRRLVTDRWQASNLSSTVQVLECGHSVPAPQWVQRQAKARWCWQCGGQS